MPLSVFGVGLSAPTNGVYWAIGAWRNGAGVTNEPIRLDDVLIFAVFCNTGQVELSYPLDPAYGAKVRMTDADGKNVPKTALGKRFGSKFDQLRTVLDTRMYGIPAWGPYPAQDNPGLGGAKFFYSRQAGARELPPQLTPKDLFKMAKPGVYTLQIELKMFRFNPTSTNAWNFDPFCFSPVAIKVQKPSEQKPK
ncbi:MAG: hypothetical protein NT154_22470 [Verrucomicrobia bacterium]|nr:hypothetical protein [Verrucomicrobiota bacterium]